MPFSILFEIARNAANDSPQTLVISAQVAFLSVRSKPRPEAPGVPAISDAEKIERREKPMLRPTLGPVANDNLFRVVGSYNRFGAMGDPRNPSTPEHNRYRVVLSPLAEGIAGECRAPAQPREARCHIFKR